MHWLQEAPNKCSTALLELLGIWSTERRTRCGGREKSSRPIFRQLLLENFVHYFLPEWYWPTENSEGQRHALTNLIICFYHQHVFKRVARGHLMLSLCICVYKWGVYVCLFSRVYVCNVITFEWNIGLEKWKHHWTCSS